MNNGHGGGNRPNAGEASSPARFGVRRDVARLLVLLGLAAAATLLPLSVSAQAQSGETLESAVVEAMGVEAPTTAERSFAEVEDEGLTQVNVMRESEGWAFGAAVIEAPKKEGHYPRGWLFVAENGEQGWDVALEGTPEFTGSAAEAPDDIVDDEEKQTFANAESEEERTLDAKAPVKTNLMLPWAKGKVWKFTGGPHGWNTGYDRPYAALDFAGRGAKDQRVRAAGPGRVYAMCSTRQGWIRVYHPNGYTTDYYHLIQNIKPNNGAKIKRGAYLGLTGNDTSCGGASYGRHVHFALLKGTNYVPVNNKIIGGWKFVEGQAYGGYTERGGTRRQPGSLIRNFGV
jgi:LasA protease